jgi:hypothetical protein
MPSRKAPAILLVCVLAFGLFAHAQRRPAPAGKKNPPETSILWRDPGAVEKLDFTSGAGGTALRPAPPFKFDKEISSGAWPKVRVKDGRGVEWAVKWGDEIKAETFSSRLVWACGYFVEPTQYVKSGKITHATGLTRAAKFVAADGTFQPARFQIWDRNLLKKNNWTWSYNPFVGTQELDGLKILVMLTSNWDTKDARDVDTGVNTAITKQLSPSGRPEYRYMMFDWGATLGKWGLPGLVRNKWDCEGYAGQSKDFVKRDAGGQLEWGYRGYHHRGELKENVTVEDVRWLLRYLGRVTDAQLRAGLTAAGATPEETQCFAAAVRARIEQLKAVAAGPQAPLTSRSPQ